MKRDPFPLSWPDGWKRTPREDRKSSRFDGGHFVRARDGILNSLRLMRAVDPTITSDLPVKSNGMPYATGRADDPGVAVWWVQAKVGGQSQERVIACDLYKTHGENLRAIQLTIDAMRGIERWGASDLVNRAFAGFTALPPGSGQEIGVSRPIDERPWREVLEIGDALYKQLQALAPDDAHAIVKSRFKALALERHPDRPSGSREAFEELEHALIGAEAFFGVGG